ncbi:hypothetical protein [Burkholderia alba]|nr:hypothetical protein [Burkholderia alba]
MESVPLSSTIRIDERPAKRPSTRVMNGFHAGYATPSAITEQSRPSFL